MASPRQETGGGHAPSDTECIVTPQAATRNASLLPARDKSSVNFRQSREAVSKPRVAWRAI